MPFWSERLGKSSNRESTEIASDSCGIVIIVTNPPNWSLLRGTHSCLCITHQYWLRSITVSMNPCECVWSRKCWSPSVHSKALTSFLWSFPLRLTGITFSPLIPSICPGRSGVVGLEGCWKSEPHSSLLPVLCGIYRHDYCLLVKNWPSQPNNASLRARLSCWLSWIHTHIQNRPSAAKNPSGKSLYRNTQSWHPATCTLAVDTHTDTYAHPSIRIFPQCLYICKDSFFSNIGAVSLPPPLHFTGLACLQRHLKAHKAGKWNRL